MENLISKTLAVFTSPFTVPGFGETLPAGEYEIETELVSPPDNLNPDAWKASVMVKLHPCKSHPGLARTLTVSLADLDNARARDKLSGRALSDFFLEEMLVDPMVQLVMKADGVSEAHLRHLYSGVRTSQIGEGQAGPKTVRQRTRDNAPTRAAENEGMPSTSETWPPSRAGVVAAGFGGEQGHG
jgi:hypothetical protein